MNIETWFKMLTTSAFVLVGILWVLLLLTIFYKPARKKTKEITIYSMVSLVVWWLLITGIGMFFVE